MSTFAKMVERMEDLVLSGMGVPFTPLTIVNSEKLLPQLDRIRESMPEEVRNAKRILDQREEIIIEAQQRANQLMMDSKKQADQLLSESELLKAVHEEAVRIRQQILTEIDTIHKKAFEEAEAMKAKAQEEARLVREGADQYAESVLASLDKSLAQVHEEVRNGRQHLSHAKRDALAGAHARAPYATPANNPAPLPVGPTQQNAYSLPGYTPPPAPAPLASDLKIPVAAGSVSGDPETVAARNRAKIEAFLKQTTIS